MANYKNTSGDYIITVDNSDGNVIINGHLDVEGNFTVNGSFANINATDNVHITSPLTTITGNLNVVGNVTYIDVSELTVDDPFITVAANNTGNMATADFQSQGLVAQTSSNTYAGIRFNNGANTWQISPYVAGNGEPITAYANLATSIGSFLIAAPDNAGNVSAATWPTQGLVAHSSGNTYAGLRFNNDTLTWQISSSVDANGAPIGAYADIAFASAAIPGGPQYAVQFNVGNVFTGTGNLLFDDTINQLKLNGHTTYGNLGTDPLPVVDSTNLYHKPVGVGGTGLYFNSPADADELVSRRKAIVFGLIF